MDIRRTVKGRIYSKMKKLGILDLEDEEYVKVLKEPYMPLSIERHTEQDLDGHLNDVIYLSHTYVQNGDLMSDPFIKIMVNDTFQAASAIYYQNDGIGKYQTIRGIFQREDGTEFMGINQAAEKDCNQFLILWLDNIKHQGFPIKESIKTKTEVFLS